MIQCLVFNVPILPVKHPLAFNHDQDESECSISERCPPQERVDVHYDETQDKVEQKVDPQWNQQVPLSAVEDGDYKR